MKATPGPWRVVVGSDRGGDPFALAVTIDDGENTSSLSAANAEFIAAADPTVVAELCDIAAAALSVERWIVWVEWAPGPSARWNRSSGSESADAFGPYPARHAAELARQINEPAESRAPRDRSGDGAARRRSRPAPPRPGAKGDPTCARASAPCGSPFRGGGVRRSCGTGLRRPGHGERSPTAVEELRNEALHRLLRSRRGLGRELALDVVDELEVELEEPTEEAGDEKKVLAAVR